MEIPYDLTRQTYRYEKLARILLGFEFVIIFGTNTVTPSIEQLTVYIGFYNEAKSLVGQKITCKHFSDGIMEC